MYFGVGCRGKLHPARRVPHGRIVPRDQGALCPPLDVDVPSLASIRDEPHWHPDDVIRPDTVTKKKNIITKRSLRQLIINQIK